MVGSVVFSLASKGLLASHKTRLYEIHQRFEPRDQPGGTAHHTDTAHTDHGTAPGRRGGFTLTDPGGPGNGERTGRHSHTQMLYRKGVGRSTETFIEASAPGAPHNRPVSLTSGFAQERAKPHTG